MLDEEDEAIKAVLSRLKQPGRPEAIRRLVELGLRAKK
jgi:hypothetical protein